MSHNNGTRHQKEETKTLVLWDINSCPIPCGYSPREIGPRIESALKKSGCSGPITITAIGELTQNPGEDVLRDLSSTGIALMHSDDLQTDLYVWMDKNPPPANIMLIIGAKELGWLASPIYGIVNEGYKIFLASPEFDSVPLLVWKSFLFGVSKKWLWTSLLAEEFGSRSADDKQEKKRCESPWSCTLCSFAAQSFGDFITHLRSKEHAHADLDLVVTAPKDDPKMMQPGYLKIMAMQREEQEQGEEEEEEKTLVLWFINSCPIPHGYDPQCVGPRIKSALKNSRPHSGPVTITAIGNLTRSPGHHVLRALSSTGISLIHTEELETDIFRWIERNPPPANIMLISGPTELECLARKLYDLLSDGYQIFLAYPRRDPALAWLWNSFLLNVSKEWLWTSLLEDETGADYKQKEKCNETGESPWSCTPCAIAGQSLEDFTTHLKSKKHADVDLDFVASAPKDDLKLLQLKAKCNKRKIGEAEIKDTK